MPGAESGAAPQAHPRPLRAVDALCGVVFQLMQRTAGVRLWPVSDLPPMVGLRPRLCKNAQPSPPHDDFSRLRFFGEAKGPCRGRYGNF